MHFFFLGGGGGGGASPNDPYTPIPLCFSGTKCKKKAAFGKFLEHFGPKIRSDLVLVSEALENDPYTPLLPSRYEHFCQGEARTLNKGSFRLLDWYALIDCCVVCLLRCFVFLFEHAI